MEHAKVRLMLSIGTGIQEEELVIDWLTKEEWDKLSFDEKSEELQDSLDIFMWDKIDTGWKEI